MIIKVVQVIDGFSQGVAKVVSWFTLLMVLIMTGIVILRYMFGIGWISLQESVSYLHSAVFMLGAAYTLQCNDHVRVDIFYRNLSEKRKAGIDLFGTIVFLFPVCIYLFIASWDYVMNSWQIMEGSKETGGLDAVYMLKSVILIFCTMMILQGISQVGKSLLILSNKTEA